jgi:hypothetical protein
MTIEDRRPRAERARHAEVAHNMSPLRRPEGEPRAATAALFETPTKGELITSRAEMGRTQFLVTPCGLAAMFKIASCTQWIQPHQLLHNYAIFHGYDVNTAAP